MSDATEGGHAQGALRLPPRAGPREGKVATARRLTTTMHTASDSAKSRSRGLGASAVAPPSRAVARWTAPATPGKDHEVPEPDDRPDPAVAPASTDRRTRSSPPRTRRPSTPRPPSVIASAPPPVPGPVGRPACPQCLAMLFSASHAAPSSAPPPRAGRADQGRPAVQAGPSISARRRHRIERRLRGSRRPPDSAGRRIDQVGRAPLGHAPLSSASNRATAPSVFITVSWMMRKTRRSSPCRPRGAARAAARARREPWRHPRGRSGAGCLPGPPRGVHRQGVAPRRAARSPQGDGLSRVGLPREDHGHGDDDRAPTAARRIGSRIPIVRVVRLSHSASIG